ncbi:MAG: lytic transglycosylase domain-containing protein [Sulfitobacter sp.]
MKFLKVLTLIAGGCLALPAYSDAPKPYPDFQARHIKVPTAGATKRKLVQIDPAEQNTAKPKAASLPADTAAALSVAQGQYDWFWTKVSPDITKTGPGRLQLAMTTIAGFAGQVPVPRLQELQSIAKVNGIDILKATIGTRVSPALVLAVISVESAGREDAVSRAGAQGLMQLMPDTAARFGVTDSMVGPQNISGGVKYLDWLMQKFEADPILVLAGYNAGEGSVRKHAGVPPFPETRDYVPKVLAAFKVASGLCKTQPELITDGCVFATLR